MKATRTRNSVDTGDVVLSPGRCVVLGIVNVTSDSFSDGGVYLRPENAIKHGHLLAASGADYVDIGGESTRPGAQRVSVETELTRIIPVIESLAHDGLMVSVDTMRSEVAEAAIAAGAVMINDVSGGLADPRMKHLVADAQVPWILMHWVAGVDYTHTQTARSHNDGDGDIVSRVSEHLRRRVDDAIAAGVGADRIIIDPGLGFAKSAADNWQLLHGLPQLAELGLPVLVAASRKRFLGKLLMPPVPSSDTDASQSHISDAAATQSRPAAHRDTATAAVSALSAAAGAWGVRVHDVQSTVEALAVENAWRNAGSLNSSEEQGLH